MAKGHVYVLISPNCEYVKIGMTENPPAIRIRQINGSENYKWVGPWTLSDFREVYDCRAVELYLHSIFKARRVSDAGSADELFRVAPAEVRHHLEKLDPGLLVRHDVVDKMFIEKDFVLYLQRLFQFSGLNNYLNLQGAWTFSLFPSTSGGRYFTINIDRHEVAFTTLPRSSVRKNPRQIEPAPLHALVVDRLIRDFSKVEEWIEQHNGEIIDDNYASALPRSTCLLFKSNFAEAEKVFALEGVRRALIAYWSEALIRMQERGALSLFARHHNYNAVAKLASIQ
jgi:hypothetical protein